MAFTSRSVKYSFISNNNGGDNCKNVALNISLVAQP